ncbi:MAG: hypothetical protein ACOC3V_02680 [bacterium]
MNRIILKVKLIGSTGLNLQLVHLDNRFISKDNMEFLNYYSRDKVFLIYSRSDMSITINSLRLPDKKNYKPNKNVTHFFNDEKDRYVFLKNLRKCLIEWSTDFDRFKYSYDYSRRNRNLIMSKEYWII